jgi:hypothetical protein
VCILHCTDLPTLAQRVQAEKPSPGVTFHRLSPLLLRNDRYGSRSHGAVVAQRTVTRCTSEGVRGNRAERQAMEDLARFPAKD